jgi:hypothetical protein
MPFTLRKRMRIWPIRLNFTENGLNSWSFDPGIGITWNSYTRKWSFDLPGPVNYRTKGKRGTGKPRRRPAARGRRR